MKKQGYLGDGLYWSFDGFTFRLYTDRGGFIHEVYLEYSMVEDLYNILQRMKEEGESV